MRVYFTGILLLVFGLLSAQDFNDTNAIEINNLAGNILPHAPDLDHLITGHPTGSLITFSKKTHGNEEWHRVFNYPDYGGYYLYQDFKNDILGECFALGAHYNFYFLNRHLMFKIGEGIAMTTNPQDLVTNSKNNAFGSRILANTVMALNYKKENVIDKFGIQAGLIFTHFSNGRVKAPNSGINTYGINFGIVYNFEKDQSKRKIDTTAIRVSFREPIKYNFVLRTGVNESPIIGSGQKPFFHVGFYADKRLNRTSALQLGTDVFFTTYFKEFIKYKSVAYPEENLDPNTDYKRVGVFVGYELFINRISLEAQVGYYVYQPFKFDIPVYDRLGMKYYLGKQKKMFTGLSIKTHGFLAEALEFIVGVRL